MLRISTRHFDGPGPISQGRCYAIRPYIIWRTYGAYFRFENNALCTTLAAANHQDTIKVEIIR